MDKALLDIAKFVVYTVAVVVLVVAALAAL